MAKSKPPARSIFLVLLNLAYAIPGIAGVWFGGWILIPKALSQASEVGSARAVLPGALRLAEFLNAIAPAAVWVLIAFCVAGVVAIVFSRRARLLRTLGAALVMGAAWVGVVAAMLMCATAAVVSLETGHAYQRERLVFYRVLEEFSLRQSAEGRFEAALERLSGRPEVILEIVDNPAELSPYEQRRRPSDIARNLPHVSDVASLRSMIASTLPFRDRVEANPDLAGAIEEAAAAAGAPTAGEGTGALFDWLEENGGKDGWEPLPHYRFRADPGFP